MDKYDYLLDSLFESELIESLSSNQEIPGKLGNNINGVTNLDLTGQEELITSGLYDDGWDESSSSGFENLPLDDEDILLEELFEHRGKSKDPNYKTKKAAKIVGGIALATGAVLGGKKLLKNGKAIKSGTKAIKSGTKAIKSGTKAVNPTKMSTKNFSKALSNKNTVWDI